MKTSGEACFVNLKPCRPALPWCSMLALVGLASGVQAQDGRALMQRVATAYQNCNTYEGRDNSAVEFRIGGKLVQSTSSSMLMRTKRPNKLFLDFNTANGSAFLTSDGVKLSIYNGHFRQYNQAPTGSNLAGILPLLAQRAGVVAYLDPLFFLSGAGLPKELGSLQRKPDATINGHPVYVVAGTVRTQAQKLKLRNGKTVSLPATASFWTWWIDKQTSLLQKVEAHYPNARGIAQVRQGKKVMGKIIVGERMLRHTLVEPRVNPSLDDGLFAFHPPADATEMRTPAELLNKTR